MTWAEWLKALLLSNGTLRYLVLVAAHDTLPTFEKQDFSGTRETNALRSK